MKVGRVKFYNEQKGFGFIERPNDDDIFFHKTGVTPGLLPLKDMAVTFDEVEGRKGPQADNVDMSTVSS